MVSLSDIARDVKLNVSVVSRALSPNPQQNAKVKPETRERILQTAQRLNYVPNRQASFMGRKGNATIFCFMPLTSDRLTADLMYGISEAARRENFPVTFFQGSVCEDFRKFFSGLDDSTHSGVISFPSQALAYDLKDIPAGKVMETVAYKQFFNPRKEKDATSFYYHFQGESLVVYADFHKELKNKVLHLPKAAAGRKITILEKTPGMTLHTRGTIPEKAAFAVSATSGNNYIVLKLDK